MLEENMKQTAAVPKKRFRRSYIVMLCAVIVTAAGVFFAQSLSKKNKQANPGGMRRGGSTVFSVKTAVLEKTVLHDYVATNGEVEAQSSIEVFPDIGGRVVSVEVQLGSPVKKGEVIAYIDPSEPGAKYIKSPVYAPINGAIVSTPLKAGTRVSTSSVLTEIGDLRNLQVSANIPERFVALLRPGLLANVTLEAYPDVIFTATVSRVSPVVDSASRTKTVILSFDKNDWRINAGMFAKVILYTVDYSGEVVMPVDSLVTKDDRYYAFVVNDDSTVSRREVTVGKTVDAVAQILSGLQAGERVVVEGQTSLSDGAKIRDITAGVAKPDEAAAEKAGGKPEADSKAADSKAASGAKPESGRGGSGGNR